MLHRTGVSVLIENGWQLIEIGGVDVWSKPASSQIDKSACPVLLLVWQEPTQLDWEWEVMRPAPDTHLAGGRCLTREEAMHAASEAFCSTPLALTHPDHLMDSRAWHALLSSPSNAVQ